MSVSVKAETCWKCDAEVREGSMFCYGCGADLSLNDANPAMDTTKLDKSLVEETETELKIDATHTESENEEANLEPDLHLTEEPPAITKPVESKDSRPELKTAAAIKKRPKKTSRTETKYIWEEPEGLSVKFVVGGLLIFVLTAILVYFALLFH